MRVCKLTIVLACGAVLACGGGDESSSLPDATAPEVTTSEPGLTTTSGSPTTTAAPTSTLPEGTDGEVYDPVLIDGLGEDAFLTYVRANLIEFEVVPDTDLISVVRVICSTIRDGTSPDDALGGVAESAQGSGVSETQVAAFVVLHVAAIHAFCPEYSDSLPLPVP